MKIFLTGFIQVLLVTANTYFIAKLVWPGIAVCSFGISYLWTFNVKKVSFGTKGDHFLYALGAMAGGLIGVLIAKSI